MRRGGALIGVVAASLLLALWVTAGASQVTIVERRETTSDEELQQQLQERGGAGQSRQQDTPGALDLPGWVQTVADVLSTLFVVAIIGWLGWAALEAFRNRRRVRAARRRPVVPEHATFDALVERTRRELAEETGRQLDAIRHGEPRNAIVACWIALEDAVARVGVPRHESETSTEFTTRVVHRVTLDAVAVSELAALYREARFSRHPLGERHRDRAVRLLSTLADQLQQDVEPVAAGTGAAPREGGGGS